MVINDLNLGGPFVGPHKANAPLAVDPYAVLPQPVTRQSLQMIAWGTAQKVERDSRVQLRQLSFGDRLDAAESSAPSCCKQELGFGTPKGLYRHLYFIPITGMRDEKCCLCGRE
jgi:hypothetical protein